MILCNHPSSFILSFISLMQSSQTSLRHILLPQKVPFSRPNPECLTPPNGVAEFEMAVLLTPTMPYCNLLLTLLIVWIFVAKKYDAKPKIVSLASLITCSFVFKRNDWNHWSKCFIVENIHFLFHTI